MTSRSDRPRLDARVAIVTGGASSIGRATVERIVDGGHHLSYPDLGSIRANVTRARS
ncbi:MAG: hypothetical protein ACHQIG_10445 [Acidimicrobiia bacterium]